MQKDNKNIYPVFEQILGRDDKQALLKQRSKVIWMTGLSGSGKTTIAVALERELNRKGLLTQVLDGDNVRAGINKNLGFSEAERMENIRRIAEVSRLFLDCGIITINCFVSPTEQMRDLARNIIGKNDFVEIFVNTPLEICEQRDVKGLYAKARRGEIKNFTGIDAPFEMPSGAALEVKTVNASVNDCVKKISDYLEDKIAY